MNRHERRRQAAIRTKAAGKVARENNERRMTERHVQLVELRGDPLVRLVRSHIAQREQAQVAEAAAWVEQHDPVS